MQAQVNMQKLETQNKMLRRELEEVSASFRQALKVSQRLLQTSEQRRLRDCPCDVDICQGVLGGGHPGQLALCLDFFSAALDCVQGLPWTSGGGVGLPEHALVGHIGWQCVQAC